MLAENPEMAKELGEDGKPPEDERQADSGFRDDDLEPLQMADSDDSNSQTSLEKEHQTLQQQVIDENNLLGDHYFDVKSEHCL